VADKRAQDCRADLDPTGATVAAARSSEAEGQSSGQRPGEPNQGHHGQGGDDAHREASTWY